MRDKFYKFFSFVSKYAFYCLLFFIPISISIVEVATGLALLGFVGRKIIKPDFKFIKFWPNALLLLFLFFNALSLLNSGQYLDKSLHAMFGKWAQYFGIYIIVQDDIYDWQTVEYGTLVFLFSAFLVVCSGLNQYFFNDEFLRHRSMTIMSTGNMSAVTSSFAHYNSFGSYLVVVLSLISVLLLANNPFSLKTIGLSVFSMLSVVALILTFSRGSWISLSASLVFIAVFARKNFKRLTPIFLVIIAMSLFSAFHERLFLIFKAGGDADRFKYWTAAFKMINKHPLFGVGLGTFMANFSKYVPGLMVRDAYAHNCYLQIWAETGIFSLVSFMAFVFSLVYLGVKKFLNFRDYLLLGFLSGVVGFLVHIFFDTDLYSLQLAVLFWIWAGLIARKVRIV